MAGVVRTVPSHSARSTPTVVKAPRPPNAWIIYRSDKVHQLPPPEPGQPRRAQAEVSKMISNMWANESEQTRQEYERRAEEAKAAHALKYPGYRFKPMKKEEKKAQRELEINDRLAKRRKSGSTPDPSPVPPTFTAPLPQYYASITMPINLPQLGQNMPPPFPYSFVPFYPPQTRFGPAGPTPPVSAASSPSDSSSSPDASLSTENLQSTSDTHEKMDPSETKGKTPSAPSPAVPPSNSTTASEHPLFPPFNSTTFASGQEWAGAPTPTIMNNGTLTPALTPSPLWQEGDSIQQQPPIEPTVPPETVSFNFEPFHLANLDNLLSGSTDDSLSAFLRSTNNPGIFELGNVGPGELTAEPTGEIEVSLGDPLDLGVFPSDLFNFGDAFSIPQVDNATPTEFLIPQSIPSEDVVEAETHDNMGYNLDDYLDFGPSSTFGETNDIPVVAPAPAGSGAYVPPAGAANSSIRRVGGSWTKQFVKTQTPNPPRTTGMTQSQ